MRRARLVSSGRGRNQNAAQMDRNVCEVSSDIGSSKITTRSQDRDSLNGQFGCFVVVILYDTFYTCPAPCGRRRGSGLLPDILPPTFSQSFRWQGLLPQTG